jgi:hypothetical protein
MCRVDKYFPINSEYNFILKSMNQVVALNSYMSKQSFPEAQIFKIIWERTSWTKAILSNSYSFTQFVIAVVVSATLEK